MAHRDYPSWGRIFREFHCSGCASQEAYRSRARGFFEKGVLPLLFLRPVRCEHCFQRAYVFRTVPARERVPRRSQSNVSKASNSQGRVA